MSRRIVLDASAALEAVLLGPRAEAIADALEQASVVLVPGVFHSEVANALWKYVRVETLELQEAVGRFETATSLTDRTVPDADLAEEALVAAASTDHPVYDMLYAVLARRFGCTVCTLVTRLESALERMKIDSLPTGR
jgi:predicted nucleic acid-binding protein